jgi:hypothetical protein
MSQRYLKYWYGPASAFSEHQPGGVIEYLEDGRKKVGTIWWVCAPRKIASKYVGIAYVVRTQDTGRIEITFPANVLTPLEP